jgi:hypothetical protein
MKISCKTSLWFEWRAEKGGKGKCFPSPIIPRMSINEMQILKLISSLERENDDQNTFRSLHEVSDVGFLDSIGVVDEGRETAIAASAKDNQYSIFHHTIEHRCFHY